MAGSSKKGPSTSHKRTRKGKGKTSASKTKSTDPNDEDYNIRSRERTELLTKIKDIINHAPVSPALWACCQLSDMNCLQVIANSDEAVIRVLENPLALIPMQCELLGF
jgi:hypothetical protein